MWNMHFVQIRRARRALAWYILIVGLLFTVSILNAPIEWRNATYVHVQYKSPHSQDPARDLDLWEYNNPYDFALSSHWLLPWQAEPPWIYQPPPRPTTVNHTAIVIPVEAETELGKFVGTYRTPAGHYTYYPDGTVAGRVPPTLTVVGPAGERVAWSTVPGPRIWSSGFEHLTFYGLMPWVVFFTSLFALVLSTGLGEDISEHLAIIRTRPISKGRFVFTAIAIDMLAVSGAVALTLAPLSVLQISGTNIGSTILTSNVGALSVLVCWLVAIESYAIGVAVTLSRRRAVALGSLAVVAVVAVIAGFPGSVLPGPAEILRPAINALDPIHHYFTFLQAFYRDDIRTVTYWGNGATVTQFDWVRGDLVALIGTVVAAELVAVLRWRLAEV
jgi:hypothetical protein